MFYELKLIDGSEFINLANVTSFILRNDTIWFYYVGLNSRTDRTEKVFDSPEKALSVAKEIQQIFNNKGRKFYG